LRGGTPDVETAAAIELDRVGAVVLDLDGVLIDSEPVHLRAWKQALSDAGRVPPVELGRMTLGWRTVDVAAWLGEKVGLDSSELLAARNGIVSRSADRYAPFPGWDSARSRLRALDVPLAIASSGTREHVSRAIRELGLVHDLQTTRCGEDVEQGKPSPEIYLAVLRDLGVDPNHAVALEDSLNGVRSGVAAGLMVIAVGALDVAATEAAVAVGTLHEALDLLEAQVGRVQEAGEAT
jgi:beta-phosphoglucomutase-like phosphatase (HAD superfamily)